MYCLCVGRVIPSETLENAPEVSQLVQNITDERATIVFWFASNLVEEVGKTDSTSMKQSGLRNIPVKDY